MSRIAKNSVFIPKETTCNFDNSVLFAKGKMGELSINISPLFKVDLSEDNAFGFCQFDGEEFLVHIHNDLVPTEYFKTLAHELIHVRQTLEGLHDNEMREQEAYIWEDILSKDFWDTYQSGTFFSTAWTKPAILKV